MEEIRIMIVDDHLVVREGLKQLIELEDNMEVVAESSSGLDCLKIINEASPHIVFMDIRMPGINGIETTRIIHNKHPETKVIVLTIYDDDEYVTEAIKAGAKGYVLKNVEKKELVKIIHKVMAGHAFLDPSVIPKIMGHIQEEQNISNRDQKQKLTQRELEVLKGLVEGHTDRFIAETLFVSQHTIRSHVKNIYRKLNVSSKAHAVAMALKNDIIQH